MHLHFLSFEEEIHKMLTPIADSFSMKVCITEKFDYYSFVIEIVTSFSATFDLRSTKGKVIISEQLPLVSVGRKSLTK